VYECAHESVEDTLEYNIIVELSMDGPNQCQLEVL